nr:zinc finger protein 830 [Tanacetum cinerariifolium]
MPILWKIVFLTENKEDCIESDSNNDETRHVHGSMIELSKKKELKKFDFVTKDGEHIHLTEEQINQQKKIEEEVKVGAARREGEIRKEELINLLSPKVIIHYTMMSEESSQINKVHSDDNHIFDNVNHQLAQEMHQEEHLGFDDKYDFLTNTISYKKLSLVSDVENVSTEASAATSNQIAMIAILNNLTSQAICRAKLKAQKQHQRIESPLVRYNESDQPVCKVCDLVLKSEFAWSAHQVSAKHRGAIKTFKANAAAASKANNVKLGPSTETKKPNPKLPVEFKSQMRPP